MEYSETEKRFVSTHHPFTSPVLEDLPLAAHDLAVEYLVTEDAGLRSCRPAG